MAVRIGIVGEGDIESVTYRDQPRHGIRRRTIHSDLAVPINGHKAEGRVDRVVHHGRGDFVALDDRLPILDGSAAQRIDADAHAGRADRIHVDDVGEVGDIGRDEIVRMDTRCLARTFIGNTIDTREFTDEEFVGRLLDPFCDIDVRRPAIDGIVFEAAFVGRIVRWADDDPVRPTRVALAIVSQDGVANHRRRCVAALFVDHRFHPIGREHFKRAGGGGFGQCMRVHAEKEWSIGAGVAAIQADGLRDG